MESSTIDGSKPVKIMVPASWLQAVPWIAYGYGRER